MRNLSTIALIVANAACITVANEPSTSPDFSGYSQTDSFVYFTTCHKTARQSASLLDISVLLEHDCTLKYEVTDAGNDRDYRHVYGWAVQAKHEKQLSETELTSLKLAIRKLPAENSSPPLERLVIVSFRDGATWTTRSYDRDSLPQAMRQIYDILGERFETRDRGERASPPTSLPTVN